MPKTTSEEKKTEPEPTPEPVPEERYSVETVATETAKTIYDKEIKESLTIEIAIVKMMNDIEEIKKGLQG